MARHDAMIEKALAHHRAGELGKAVDLYRLVVRAEPGNATALDYLAQALELQGQIEAAVEAERRAVLAEPGNLFLRERLARLLLEADEPEQSVRVWREVVAYSGGAPATLVGLARQLSLARRADEGLKVALEAAARYPDDLQIAHELARSQERLGNDPGARPLLERILARHPAHAECNGLLARIDARAGGEGPGRARVRLERVAATAAGLDLGLVLKELALVLDKLGEYDAAFATAARGQAATLDSLPARDKDAAQLERMIERALAITRDGVAAWARPGPGADEPSSTAGPPAFVVGFPRSGTTLVEQMLGAHPRLAVSDETPTLQGVRRKMQAVLKPKSLYPACLGEFTGKQVSDGRRWYLERVYRSVPKAHGEGGDPPRRIIDKQPLNTVDMCFARLILPESPVIYVLRDPRDTVLSVFMQGFSRGVPHLFSLEGTARLYDLFARAWKHYLETLGQRTLTVRYEDLVADPEREARRMIEFLDESWDPAVLRYHEPEHRRMVTTPSYADVSQPVYTRAMGRWRKYARQLEPVMGTLKPWVEAGGYE